MIEHPHSQYDRDYYTPKERASKEDQLLREVRDRAELLEEVRTLKRIMAAIASHLGASWR